MKKTAIVFLISLAIILFYVPQIFCQELTKNEITNLLNNGESSIAYDSKQNRQSDANEMIQSIISKTRKKGRSSDEFSHDPGKFSSLLGTKWNFSITIGTKTFIHEITFEDTVWTSSNSDIVGLGCTDQYGDVGLAVYGDLSDTIGGEGFLLMISSDANNFSYYYKISGNSLTGLASFESKSSGNSHDFDLTGTLVSAPSDDPADNNDGTNCKIMAKSLTISNNSIPTTSTSVNFTVEAISDCSSSLYYYYSYAPDYGTDNYGKSEWVKMAGNSNNGFTSSKSISYKFPNPGYYVVVAWISPQMAATSPVNMIGCTVAVK